MIFDAHCDTLLKVYEGKGTIHKNNWDVSFEKLCKYGRAVQTFAVFNEGYLTKADIMHIINILKNETLKSDVAQFCVTREDIENCEKCVSALCSLEGIGNTADLEVDDIDTFYDIGVRIAGITWNQDNRFCGGIDNNDKGFTPLGYKLLQRMKELGMILDVSHISDKGFFEAAEIDGLKIVATHSNSRTVCPHNRNLTDEQFRVLISRQSVTGLNLYPLFVNGTNEATVTDLVPHIEHLCALGGEKNIGLGADFDGIDYKMKDINSCEKMNILFEELAKLNYKDSIIRGISYENFLNFLNK